MLYMPFLYFPEDKSEYLPATITLILIMVFAAIAVYFVFKRSRKDEQKFEDKYKDRLKEIEEELKKNK